MSEQQALVSQNARKHGILAAGVTPGEVDQMAGVAAAFHDDLRPAGMVETALVEKIALTYLQLQRCAQAEAALFESAWRPNTSAYRPDGDLGTGSSLHVAPLERIANLIARYDTTLTNRLLKLLKTLEVRQLLRGKAAQELPRDEGRSSPAGAGMRDEVRQTALPAEADPPSEGPGWVPDGVSRNEGHHEDGAPGGNPEPSERAPRAAPSTQHRAPSTRPVDGFWREEPEHMPNSGRSRWR